MKIDKISLELFNATLDKLLVQLPTKYVDTRFVLIVQIIFCLLIYSGILYAQLVVANRCIVPIPSSFINK